MSEINLIINLKPPITGGPDVFHDESRSGFSERTTDIRNFLGLPKDIVNALPDIVSEYSVTAIQPFCRRVLLGRWYFRNGFFIPRWLRSTCSWTHRRPSVRKSVSWIPTLPWPHRSLTSFLQSRGTRPHYGLYHLVVGQLGSIPTRSFWTALHHPLENPRAEGCRHAADHLLFSLMPLAKCRPLGTRQTDPDISHTDWRTDIEKRGMEPISRDFYSRPR